MPIPRYEYPQINTPVQTQGNIANAAAAGAQRDYYRERNLQDQMERQKEQERILRQRVIMELYKANLRKDSKGVAYYDHEKIHSGLVERGYYEEAQQHAQDQVKLKKERLEATSKQRESAEEAVKAMLPYLKAYVTAENRLAVYNSLIVPVAREKQIEWIPDEWNSQIDERLVSLYHNALDEKSRLLTPEEEEQQVRMAKTMDRGRATPKAGRVKKWNPETQQKEIWTTDPISGLPVEMIGIDPLTPQEQKLAQDLWMMETGGKQLAEGNLDPSKFGRGKAALGMKITAAEEYGFNEAQAQLDMAGLKRWITAMNDPARQRLSVALKALGGSVKQAKKFFQAWKSHGKVTGFRDWNYFAMEKAKKLPGPAGRTANGLFSHIPDMQQQIANVYAQGYAPTKEGLLNAQRSLSSEWNEEQFYGALAMVEENRQIMVDALAGVTPQGMSEQGQELYVKPRGLEPGASGPKKYRYEDGKLVPVQ
jgi:hypothetical protein